MLISYDTLDVPGICNEKKRLLKKLLEERELSVRDVVNMYLKAHNNWTDIVRAYQVLICAGKIPNTGMVWKIARIVFRETPAHLGLRHWSENLGPENWDEAWAAAEASEAAEAAQAAVWMAEAVGWAAQSADRAAEIAAKAVWVAGWTIGWEAAQSTAQSEDWTVNWTVAQSAAEKRIRNEIILMICAEVEAIP